MVGESFSLKARPSEPCCLCVPWNSFRLLGTLIQTLISNVQHLNDVLPWQPQHSLQICHAPLLVTPQHLLKVLHTAGQCAAGGIQMTVCLVIIAIVLAQAGVGQEGHVNEPWVAWFVLVFVCIYIAAYAWSCKLLAPSSLVVFLSTGGPSGCVTWPACISTDICQSAY